MGIYNGRVLHDVFKPNNYKINTMTQTTVFNPEFLTPIELKPKKPIELEHMLERKAGKVPVGRPNLQVEEAADEDEPFNLEEFKLLVLIKDNYLHSNHDLIMGYFHNANTEPILFVGHWNDGVVK